MFYLKEIAHKLVDGFIYYVQLVDGVAEFMHSIIYLHRENEQTLKNKINFKKNRRFVIKFQLMFSFLSSEFNASSVRLSIIVAIDVSISSVLV